MIASLVPMCGMLNSAPVVLPGPTIDDRLKCCLLANLNAFVLDFVARQKVGNVHLNFFIVNQLPLFPPAKYDETCPWDSRRTLRDWIVERVLELVYTAEDMRPLARACGYEGNPYVWDDDRRDILRAELDAAYFLLYGLSRDEVVYVLNTFTGTRRKDERRHGHFRSADLTLANYDRLRGQP